MIHRVEGEGRASNRVKIWSRAFILILLVNFCHQMGQQMMNTLVPKQANELGASAYLIGMLSSVFAISSLLIRPVATPAFDSFSKKKLLLISIFGIFIVFVIYGVSQSVTGLLAGRLLHGACVGCIAPLSLAIASDTLPDSQIGKGIGVFSLCQAVGQAVGPNLGLTLSRRIGFQTTFFIGAAVMLAALAIALLIKEPAATSEPYRIMLSKIVEKDAIHAAVMMFFLMFSYMCINSYLAIFGGLLGIENIGLYFTVYAVFLLATRPISGMLIDKYGYDKVMIPGMICFAVSFLVMGFSRTLPGFLIAATVNAFGYGVCYPALQSMSMSCVPKKRRGAAGSTSYLGADFAALVGPLLAGLIIDGITSSTGSRITAYSWIFSLMTLPIFACLAYFLVVRKKIFSNILMNTKDR